MQDIKPGLYKHYKGKKYEVIGIANHSETLEKLVVYRARYDSKEFGDHALWVRPKKEFFDIKESDGKKTSRFTYIREK